MQSLKSFASYVVASFIGISAATAQAFPDHPIRIVVPQPPGGGFDTVARVLAESLQQTLGQPVIVENKPGAGTLVGTDYAAKAAPDGYTLLLGGTSNMALNLGLYPKIPYDPVRDFTPVGLAVSWPFMLLTRKDLPYRTVKDIVDDARARPDKLTFASAGVGSGQQVATAVFAYLAGLKLVHVPYNGAQAAYGDLLGGRVDLFSDNAQTAMPQVKGDTVRAIAVTTAKRYPVMPDLPTIAESGLAPIDMETWFGLFAPSATPAPVLAKLSEAVVKARTSPQVIDIFTKTGGTLKTLSSDEEKSFARSEAERWSKLLRDAGIRAE